MSQQNKWRKAKSLFSTTLVTGIGTGTGDTITLNSTSGLPTDTEITLTFGRVDSDGNPRATNLVERITGVISGSTLTSYTRGVDGTTEQAHASSTVVEYVWNADDWNDAVDSFLTEHNDAGTHKSALVTTLKATGAEVTTGTEDAKIVTPKALKDAGIVAVTPYSDWQSVTGLSYASADDPTFVITTATDLTGSIGVGMRLKLTQTTVKYFIVTAITSNSITVYGGTDYDLANATITDAYFSSVKCPLGFPMSPAKWGQDVELTAWSKTTGISDGTWYSTGQSITLPIGVWVVDAYLQLGAYNGSGTVTGSAGLSTDATNPISNRWFGGTSSNSGNTKTSRIVVGGIIESSSKTTLTAIIKGNFSPTQLYLYGDTNNGYSQMKAVCAYL